MVWHLLEEVHLDACLEEEVHLDAYLEVVGRHDRLDHRDHLDHLDGVGLLAFLEEVHRDVIAWNLWMVFSLDSLAYVDFAEVVAFNRRLPCFEEDLPFC